MSFVPFSPLLLALVLSFACVPFTSNAISSCNGPCRTLNDCAGQLICINGKCNDDPDVGTHICTTTVSPPPPTSTRSPPPPPPSSTRSPPPPPPPPTSTRSPPPPPPSSGCQSSGTLVCGGVSYPQYSCSPPVTSSTSAILTNNDFSEGGDGGGPSECDDMYHQNSELIVALSTGWYSGGSRCFKMINITSVKTGRTVKAEVIDECDSINGCDAEHAYQPPYRQNIVDGSDAVWSALGLDKNVGVENVTWSMA